MLCAYLKLCDVFSVFVLSGLVFISRETSLSYILSCHVSQTGRNLTSRTLTVHWLLTNSTFHQVSHCLSSTYFHQVQFLSCGIIYICVLFYVVAFCRVAFCPGFSITVYLPPGIMFLWFDSAFHFKPLINRCYESALCQFWEKKKPFKSFYHGIWVTIYWPHYISDQ